jgi:hypothetical protein
MPPPERAPLVDGSEVELRPLAEEACRRYRAEFPDEQGRYGDAVGAWCVHDNQHILSWALLGRVYDETLLERQVAWLAGVLGARSFPLERLARDLELAADVLEASVPGAADAAAALRAAADGVTKPASGGV